MQCGFFYMTGQGELPFKRSFCAFSSPTEQNPVFNFTIQIIALNVYCKQTDFILGRTSTILKKNSKQKRLKHRFRAYANVLNFPFE